MPSLISKPRAAKSRAKLNGKASEPVLGDVLTAAEAAGFLRVDEAKLIELAESAKVPGRKIGDDWRFLHSALEKWLDTDVRENRLMEHAGAIPFDEDTKAMLKNIYRRRKRSAAE